MADIREQLIELQYSFECPRPEDLDCKGRCCACMADHLIVNGVTIEQSIDLYGKCGSCIYAKQVSGAFGNSKCYVRCTNAEHLKKHCKHASSELRQRTHKACKSYLPNKVGTEKG